MNVAIIGLGAIAPLHVDALLACGQKIVALCDVEAEKCKQFNKKYALNAREYTDYKQMILGEDLDSVHICTPHYLHAEMAIFALGKNINVLTEKPLAISEKQLDELEIAVKNSKAQLGVCFQTRYNPSVLYIKNFFQDKEVKAAEASIVWKRGADYYAQGAWRGTKAQEGGGVMINQAIHTLDLLQWICGYPKNVTAHVSNNSLKGVIEVEDTAFGMFSLNNGGNFIINATNASKATFTNYLAFQTDGFEVRLMGDYVIVNGRHISKKSVAPVIGKKEWGGTHVDLIHDFYGCLLSGEKFKIDFYEGAKTVRLILKMYASNGENLVIDK